MSEYQRAVPVLQVANVETSLRWYVDVLGSSPTRSPVVLHIRSQYWRRDGAEIMLQCADEPRVAQLGRAQV